MPGALRKVKSRLVKPRTSGYARPWTARTTRFGAGSTTQVCCGAGRRSWGPSGWLSSSWDSGDPLRILRDAEQAIGLSADTLQRVTTKTNRSLSYEEAALVRQWLVQVEQKLPLPAQQYHQWIRRGALWGLVDGRQPGPDEHAIRTPDWALEAVDARTRSMIEAIRSDGVAVYGDLEDLIVGTHGRPR